MNCFRYLDFKSFAEVDRLTIPEYDLLMEAVKLREIDKDYRNHLQAFLNFAVKATKKSGKRPVYTKFEQFYDYKKKVREAKKKDNAKSQYSNLGKFFKKEG